MLSIPTEVLPRFCPDPRAVAALAGTCGAIAARLRESRPIFVITKECCTTMTAESEYYKYEFNGSGPPAPGVRGRTNWCGCIIYDIGVISRSQPVWLIRKRYGLLVMCGRPEDIYALRCCDFMVYQLYTISTTFLLQNKHGYFEADTVAVDADNIYLNYFGGTGFSSPGALVYKQVRDCFCA